MDILREIINEQCVLCALSFCACAKMFALRALHDCSGKPNCSSFSLFYTYTRRCHGSLVATNVINFYRLHPFNSSQDDCSVITQKTFWVKAFPYLPSFCRFHFHLTVYKIVLEQVAIKLAVLL